MKLVTSMTKGIVSNKVIDGFRAPVDNWVRDRLGDHIEDYVFSSRFMKEHFDVDFIRQLCRRYTNYQKSHGYRMWVMLVLGIWLKMNKHE